MQKGSKKWGLNSTAGITLIALVVTIIILLILAGVALSAISGNGIFGRAEEAAFKTKMASYKEQAEMYVSDQMMETLNMNRKKYNAGELLKNLIDDGYVETITKDDVSLNIEDILDGISKQEKEYLVVYEGELCYVSSNTVSNNEKQEQWCREIGIRILDYQPATGIVVRNGNYEFVNGVYLCTPNVASGFNEEVTRYLEVNKDGNLTPGNWIKDKPNDNWYDYKNQKWANIYVEDGGKEVYYVWIPRYCFVLDQEKERSDVKFIDLDNSYKDENGNVTNWQDLEADGYQVPEAFTFNGQELPGYWAMKYTAEDIAINTQTTLNYDMSVIQGVVTIKNIITKDSVTASNPIAKYTVALNGNIIKTITNVSNINAEIIEFSNLRAGDNTINVTALNANDEIVGSMTKEYATAVVNPPDLTGFEPETTFYVTYDANGKENSTIPITEATPKYWYEYGESRWANIVTRNNGLETYYTWIPRYEFKLDQGNQRSIVKFIRGTTTETSAGYQIPEAFTFNGQELTGYWAMKYTAGTEAAPRFDTEVVATSSSIRTKGITGTAKAEGQVYKYYLNGQYQDQRTNADETFEFSNLKPNTKYTILVEIRDSSTDEHLGVIVKQIHTIDANQPELLGFNEEMTYYVLYDEEGNETIGSKVKNDGSNMPKNWYNYSQSKWANIVVTNGEVKNGQITGATMTTYYTWIPRYEFMITSSQQAQPQQGRVEVRFVEGKTNETSKGYQIPEAFTFNGEELAGYWAMKYTAGE